MQTPEEQAEEILILEGFAEPEDLEPELAELLRQHHEWILQVFSVEPFLYADDDVK